MSSKPEVILYTDGAAAPNPGPGGYGVVLLYGEHRKELSEGFLETTNNRMELLAVIAGLEALKKPCRITLYSDSRYVLDAIRHGTVKRWRANGWMRSKTDKAKNVDLWQRFLEAAERHELRLEWVRGHTGVEENERCDQLAVAASKLENRLEDAGYEPGPRPETVPRIASELEDKSIRHQEPGEACRKCSTPLIRKETSSKNRKPDQSYYYAWYLYCPGCRAMYFVKEAKREVAETRSMF